MQMLYIPAHNKAFHHYDGALSNCPGNIFGNQSPDRSAITCLGGHIGSHSGRGGGGLDKAVSRSAILYNGVSHCAQQILLEKTQRRC